LFISSALFESDLIVFMRLEFDLKSIKRSFNPVEEGAGSLCCLDKRQCT